jgi:hypothetical protein
MKLCPACARGEHADHVQSGLHTWMGQAKSYRCTCPGNCGSDSERISRLMAAGLIAPPSVRRLD